MKKNIGISILVLGIAIISSLGYKLTYAEQGIPLSDGTICKTQCLWDGRAAVRKSILQYPADSAKLFFGTDTDTQLAIINAFNNGTDPASGDNTIYNFTLLDALKYFTKALPQTGLDGYVKYNGSNIEVINGKFLLNGIIGSIDTNGNVTYNGQTKFLFDIDGIDGYQITGKDYVPNGPSGTVKYFDGKIVVTIDVKYGKFELNNKTGFISKNGVVTYDGQSMPLFDIYGVDGYQITGKDYVPHPDKALTGYVMYNKSKIDVRNGVFILNNKLGKINKDGIVTYNGQTKFLFDIDGVEGYEIIINGKGQGYASNTNKNDFKSFADKNVIPGYGTGMNAGRSESWKEYNNTTPNASQAQINAWMKANPTLTPKEVFSNMVKYRIHYYAIQGARQAMGDTMTPYYSFNMGRFGSYKDALVEGGVVTTKELYNAGLIEINPTGMGRGGFGSLDGIFNGDNVYIGAGAGWLNKGVMYADRYGIPPVSGRTSEDVYFSQKDLDEAKGYRSAGYWGPKDSGDMDIEFTKAGYVTGEGLNRRYTYGGTMWRNDKPTGPNIADPKVYKIVSSGSTTSTPIISSFSGSPMNITTGQSSILIWKSTNTDKCTLTGTGNVSVNGTTIVSPKSTTKYDMICYKGTAPSAVKSVTVTVNGITLTGSTSTGTMTTNPYSLTLSASVQNVINTWITKNIKSRSATLSSANYTKFVKLVISRLEQIKAITPASNVNKINLINYLVWELQQILNDSILNGLFS